MIQQIDQACNAKHLQSTQLCEARWLLPSLRGGVVTPVLTVLDFWRLLALADGAEEGCSMSSELPKLSSTAARGSADMWMTPRAARAADLHSGD